MSTFETTVQKGGDFLQRMTKQDQAVAAAVTLTAVATAIYATRSSTFRKNLPPFVSAATVINGVTYNSDPRKWTEQVAEMHGGTFRTDVIGRETIVVSRELAREVFLTDGLSFTRAVEDFTDILGMFGIKDGRRYDHSGRFVTMNLTPNLRIYTKRVNEQLNIVLDRWLGDLKGAVLWKPKVIPHLFPFVQGMVAKASTCIFLGEEMCNNAELVASCADVTKDVGQLLRRNWWTKTFPTLNSWYQRYVFPNTAVVQKHRKIANQYIAPEIEKRLQQEQDPTWKRPDDLLQKLIDAHPTSDDYGIPYVDYIINWVFLLVFASIHTTTDNTTAVLYWLMKHPQYIDELRQEQEAVIEQEGTKGSDLELTFDAVKKMVKLDSFVREVLRTRTQDIIFTHKNISGRDVEMSNGTIVPPGSYITINSWDISFNPDLQGDAVDDFQPWRFLGSNRQAVKVGEDHLTFGIGKHACPGRFFAVQEIKTIVSLLISKYNMTAATEITLPTTFRGMAMGAIKFEKRTA